MTWLEGKVFALRIVLPTYGECISVSRSAVWNSCGNSITEPVRVIPAGKVLSLSLLAFGMFLPVVGLVDVAFLSLDFAHRARPYNCEFSWSVNQHRRDADSMLCALCSGRAYVVQLNHCPLLSLRTIHHRYFRSLSGLTAECV